MSTSQEAPALIQYACERCKTRFVLPPSSRRLSLAGKFRAFSMGAGRTFRLHEGLGAGYDASRRQLLAKMDDEAYQSFVQSFRFCHECRQFVCNECWSTSRRSCLTCVAKSMTGTVRPRPPFAPTGPEIPRPIVAAAAPRKGRLRRDVALVALAIAVVMVSLEAGIMLVNATGAPGAGATGTPNVMAQASPSASPSLSPSPSESPSESPSPIPTASPSPSPSDSPSPSPSASPSASASAAVTPRPAPKITPTPAIKKPTIACHYSGTTAVCSVNAGPTYYSTDVFSWSFSEAGVQNKKGSSGHSASYPYGAGNTCYHSIQLTVSRKGVSSATSNLFGLGGTC
jgi:hypothetical protein